MTGKEKENIKKEKKKSRGGASNAEVVYQKLEMKRKYLLKPREAEKPIRLHILVNHTLKISLL